MSHATVIMTTQKLFKSWSGIASTRSILATNIKFNITLNGTFTISSKVMGYRLISMTFLS